MTSHDAQDVEQNSCGKSDQTAQQECASQNLDDPGGGADMLCGGFERYTSAQFDASVSQSIFALEQVMDFSFENLSGVLDLVGDAGTATGKVAKSASFSELRSRSSSSVVKFFKAIMGMSVCMGVSFTLNAWLIPER